MGQAMFKRHVPRAGWDALLETLEYIKNHKDHLGGHPKLAGAAPRVLNELDICHSQVMLVCRDFMTEDRTLPDVGW